MRGRGSEPFDMKTGKRIGTRKSTTRRKQEREERGHKNKGKGK